MWKRKLIIGSCEGKMKIAKKVPNRKRYPIE
jgi:hypothetical protein